MIDYHATLTTALNNILPTFYELNLNPLIDVPCISYMERNNYVEAYGDTLGYSKISYQVKVWGYSIEQLQQYALLIDNALRELGFKRVSSGELYDINSTMKQKILVYEALAKEDFNYRSEK